AATTLMLGLPGSAYLYQGEELGLPDATDLPGEVRQDPTYLRTGQTILGRDGCRIPMPWTLDGPSHGFGPTADTWLPQPQVYGQLAVDQQDGVAGSTLELYRSLLRLRRERHLGAGRIEEVPATAGVLAYIVTAPSGLRTAVVLNAGSTSAPLPLHGEVVAESLPGVTDGHHVRANAAVWLDLRVDG
ncbi:MAG: alpha-amylase, partial [Intrasporangiaceae bacterium]|nr:alpha-amylase [Intrasporangiaceae bacterium]